MNHFQFSNRGAPDDCDRDPVTLLIESLEGLPPGFRLTTRDGSEFIRVDRICFCFCNLANGRLCSAKDICYRYGGVAAHSLGRKEN